MMTTVRAYDWRSRVLLLVLTTVLVWAGLGVSRSTAAEAYTISGTVKAQSTGLGVYETQVVVREATTEKQVATGLAAIDGSYSTEPSIPAGTYNIEYVPPVASGYGTSQDRNETISGNRTINVLLVPAGSAHFSGRLFGEGGVALANATMYIGAEPVTTAADGSFSVSVAPGSYSFRVYGSRQSGVSSSVVPRNFELYGGEISLPSSLSENITLPLHAVTVKTVGPGGSAIPGVKFSGGLSESYLGGYKTLAPGITVRYAYTSQEETTNASGEATLSVAEIPATTATIEAVPPKEAGVVRTPINLAKVTTDEKRELKMSAGVTFSGRLFGEGGVALANATMYIGAEPVTTAADGSFSVSVAPGSYSFRVYGSRQSGVSSSVVPRNFELYGGEISLPSSLSENITLPLHAVTVKTVGPGGSAIPGVKFSGGLSESYLGGYKTLAPGITVRYAYTSQEETTNASGEATLSVAEIPATTATIEAVPPSETQLVRVAVNLSKVTEDQTRLVAFGKSGTDTTPPEIKCGEPTAGWHAENVAIACTASDSGTGLAHPEDASFTLTTSVGVGEETTTAYTGTHRVCDKADNCAEAGPLGPVEIDRKAPAITITTPAEGATIEQYASVKASYACSDGGSGVATCVGTVPSGAAIETGALGSRTLSVSSTDAVGNKSAKSVSYTVVASGDHTPPTINCATADSSWHASNQTVACTAADSESGLAHPGEEATFTLSTNVAEGEETASAQTSTRKICDVAGNCATAGPVGPFKIDRKPPAISVTFPENGELVTQGSSISAAYSCTDAGSGVASCEGSVLSGAFLETATLGKHALTVSATDNVGNASTKTVNYTVIASDCVEEAQLCNEGIGDTTAPSLTRLELSPASVNTTGEAQTVTVTLGVSDSQSGVAGAQVSLSGPAYYSTVAHLTGGSRLKGEWQAQVTLPHNAPKGTYMMSVGVADNIGNRHTYSPGELASQSFPDSIEQTGQPATQDTQPPQVLGVSASPENVSTCASSQTVTVVAHESDETGVASMTATLTGPGGQKYSAAGSLVNDGGTAKNGRWSAVVGLPRYAQQGDWNISIQSSDTLGNSAFLSAGQLSADGYTSRVEQTCAGDTTPPFAKAITLTPEALNTSSGAQNVVVAVDASDDLSGVASLSATLSSGSQHHEAAATLTTGNSLEGTWTATIQIPQWSHQGVWQLSIHTADQVGNEAQLTPTELGEKHLPSSIEQTGEEDSTPPVIEGCSVSPNTVETSSHPALVKVRLNASDLQSGMALAEARFVSHGGQELAAVGTLVAGTGLNGEWQIPFEFPQYSEHGAWRLQLEVWDAFGNKRTYTSGELIEQNLCRGLGVGQRPVVSAVAPRYGRLEGGTQVTITGEHLEGADAVYFGTRAGTIHSDSAGEIIATAPAGEASGAVDVTVATEVATSETSEADKFTYVHENTPTVSRLSAKKGPAAGGITITIAGTELEGVTAVMFGSRQASQIHNISSTTITAVAPEGTAGTVHVTLTTPYGTSPESKKAQFKYEGPVITQITPGSGPLAGGNTITISGIGFAAGTNTTTFKVGKGVSTHSECSSTTSCTVLVPAAAKPGIGNVIAAVGKSKSKKNTADQYSYE